LNKIDNGLSIKPKRLINRTFNSILAVLFLITLFHKSNFYAPELKYYLISDLIFSSCILLQQNHLNRNFKWKTLISN